MNDIQQSTYTFFNGKNNKNNIDCNLDENNLFDEFNHVEIKIRMVKEMALKWEWNDVKFLIVS